MTDKYEEIFEQAKARMDRAVEFEGQNRALAEEDVNFLQQEQWEESAKRNRQETQRPMLTIDRLSPRVDQLVGAQRQSRLTISVRAVDLEINPKVRNLDGTKDYNIAQVFDGIIRSIESSSSAEHAYDTAYAHAVGHGFGFWRVLTEFTDNDIFDQSVIIRRIVNPFTVHFDPSSELITREDANWCFITSLMDDETYEEEFGSNRYSGRKEGENNAWREGDKPRIAEYIWKEPKKKEIWYLNTGRVIEVTDRIKDELTEKGIFPLRTRIVDSHTVRSIKLSETDVLEKPKDLPGKYIPIVPCYGREQVNRQGMVIYSGIIRRAKDAQRMFNYWRSTSAELVALQPMAPFILEEGQVGDYKEMWESSDKPHAFLVYKHVDGVEKPRRDLPPTMSQGAISEVKLADEDIAWTTGQHTAAMGANELDPNQSGEAIKALQHRSDIGAYVFQDNLQRAIKHTGKILVDYIPRVYDSERVVAMMNNDKTQDYIKLNTSVIDEESGEVVKINDLSVGRYDVEIAARPGPATQRNEAVAALTSVIKSAPQLLDVVGDLYFSNMDWPGADELAKRMRKLIRPGLVEGLDESEQQPGPTQEQIQQMVFDGIRSAGLEIEQFKADTQRMKEDNKAQNDRIETAIKLLEAMTSANEEESNVDEQIPAMVGDYVQGAGS